MNQDIKKFLLRLPKRLYNKLREKALKEDSNMTVLAIKALEDFLK